MSMQEGANAVALEVRDLRTWFQTREAVFRAVDGVAFTLRRGRTLCLVGESGSGKSVTALSVMRLIERPGRIMPGSRILLGGQDLVEAGEERLRTVRGNEISMIFQEPMTSLNPVETIGAQISEAVRLHRRVSRREARERAREVLGLVGMPSPEQRLRDYPHQLSGGMRQRAMIAMALSCDPSILIADEPTTALDVTIQAQILALVRRLSTELGMATLLITHDLGVVAQMADEVAVMYAGKIVERGPVSAIFESPQHPYTEGLLRSIPLLGMSRSAPLRTIRGVVPSAASWPAGCRFAPRCDHAYLRCNAEEPPLLPVGGHDAACWLCEQGPRPTLDRSP